MLHCHSLGFADMIQHHGHAPLSLFGICWHDPTSWTCSTVILWDLLTWSKIMDMLHCHSLGFADMIQHHGHAPLSFFGICWHDPSSNIMDMLHCHSLGFADMIQHHGHAPLSFFGICWHDPTSWTCSTVTLWDLLTWSNIMDMLHCHSLGFADMIQHHGHAPLSFFGICWHDPTSWTCSTVILWDLLTNSSTSRRIGSQCICLRSKCKELHYLAVLLSPSVYPMPW